jgi:hypothetical protein
MRLRCYLSPVYVPFLHADSVLLSLDKFATEFPFDCTFISFHEDIALLFNFFWLQKVIGKCLTLVHLSKIAARTFLDK